MATFVQPKVRMIRTYCSAYNAVESLIANIADARVSAYQEILHKYNPMNIRLADATNIYIAGLVRELNEILSSVIDLIDDAVMATDADTYSTVLSQLHKLEEHVTLLGHDELDSETLNRIADDRFPTLRTRISKGLIYMGAFIQENSDELTKAGFEVNLECKLGLVTINTKVGRLTAEVACETH